jgi:D-xylose transport system substrate-binding protein
MSSIVRGPRARRLRHVGPALALCVVLAGCAETNDPTEDVADASSANADSKKIAFLLPQTGVPRFERWDKVFFEEKIAELCSDCEVLYHNAQNEDAARQQQQAEAALTEGAAVMVIAPVDGKAAKAIADRAKAKGVPVISYERLTFGSDNVKAHTTHEAEEVGRLQAASLVAELKKRGDTRPVLMINGAPTSSDANLFKAGAEAGFQEAGVEVLASFDTPGWDPAKAQAQMDQWITKFGADGFSAVYAANGGTAGGAIASMKAAGVDPSDHPVSGQDADLSEVQRILEGTQFMTIFRPLNVEADLAAAAAVALMNGEALPPEFDSEVDNGSGTPVPSAVLPVTAVDVSNIQEVLIDTGYFTVEEICTPEYQAACKKAGLL